MQKSSSRPPAALTPPPGNPRFPLFDGLRAIAALSVLVYHAGYYSRANEGAGGLSPYLARLNVGVAVFFVISGFLLYRPLLAARLEAGPPVHLRDYARRRVLRIVPAYWIALTVLAVYPGLPDMFSGRWWIYYGFGQDYSNSHVANGIGPAWSLGCEVVFYALLPFISMALGWAAKRLHRHGASGARLVSWRLELTVLALLAAASFVWRAYAHSHAGVAVSTFASTFGWFALGMALALASVTAESRREAVARYAWLGWVGAAAAYIGICRGLGLSTANVFFQNPSTAQDLAVYALSGVVALGLALPAAFDGSSRGVIAQILGWRPVAWLGLVSYGIYLYHQPIASALNGGIASGGNATTRFAWLLAATAAIAITAAALSYYVLERPLLRLKDARLGGPRSEARPA